MASTYPLVAPLRNPEGADSSLMYGRSRHESPLLMLDTLTDLAN
ncbi:MULTISPECIES: hypothetical protein [Glutamicibacter]|uniref:Uncharacterized protein n=1 Tax=Glutamicibacter bergerei TaxID=256702 RepID=A0ABV9MRU8_9MICC|nr:hypothetical protein [Glutamicibacter arilaitensis]